MLQSIDFRPTLLRTRGLAKSSTGRHVQNSQIGGFSISTAWRASGLLYAVTAASVLAAGATNMAPSLGQTGLMVLAGIGVAIGPLLYMLSDQIPDRALTRHLPDALAITLIVPGLMMSGDAETAMLIIYVMPLVHVAMFLPIRATLIYLVVTALLVGSTYWRHADEMMAGAQSLVTWGTSAVVVAVAAAARLQLVRIGQYADELSGLDSLTGLANTRRLNTRLDLETQRATSQDRSLMLFMIDLDDFKSVNDIYSHSCGDEMLRAVSRAICDQVRATDLVVRRGGDEFAIITESRDGESLENFVGRVRSAISAARLRICPDLTSTASVGHATCHPGDSAGDLLARADAALHAAKDHTHRGRGAARRRGDIR